VAGIEALTKEFLMKPLFVLPMLVALARPALAEKGFTGFPCENECPLAQQANLHRSFGTEALMASAAARTELVQRVESGFHRI
jgi:hypothetical protein